MLLTQLSALLGLAGSSLAVKFMPLGDSITEITCWRAYIWDQLGAAGIAGEVDFVGSVNNNPQGCTTQTPNFDMDHEGHSGWTAIDIANNYLTGWLQATTPDIVQFMLGTNDITQGHSTDEIIAAYDSMVTQMRASNPNMRIIIDKLIPISFAQGSVDDLNSRISAWADGLSTEESPIDVADCSLQAGFTVDMLRDGVHPNDQGDQFMANAIGPVLIDAINAVA